MGQRATFITSAIDAKSGERITNATTVQWSTYVHKNIPEFAKWRALELLERYGLETPNQAISEQVFNEIKQMLLATTNTFQHIGCLNLNALAKDENGVLRAESNIRYGTDIAGVGVPGFQAVTVDDEGTKILLNIEGYFVRDNTEDQERISDNTTAQVRKALHEHSHQEDGVGIIYDDRKPNELYFYTDKEYEQVFECKSGAMNLIDFTNQAMQAVKDEKRKHTFFWGNGTTEVLMGDSAEDALNEAGCGHGALAALCLYVSGGDFTEDYEFNKETGDWNRRAQ